MHDIKHIHFKSIPSTHVYAKNHSNTLLPGQIQLVTADYQTAGIGTKDTHWISPANVNIYATYSLIVNKIKLKNMFVIPHVTCLQVSKLLESEGLEPKIKWVNDVMINQAKICGILSQSIITTDTDNNLLIVSVGLNVNSTQDQFIGLDQKATSMRMQTNRQYIIEELIMKLSDLLIDGIDGLFTQGFSKFYPQINARMEKFDSNPIKFKNTDTVYEIGIIEGIDEKGALILTTCSGIKKYFNGSIIPPNAFK